MKEKLSFIFKVLIVIVSGLGLYLNFRLLTFRESIIYFTIQSNLLCFLYFLGLVIFTITKKLKRGELYYISKGMITMAITITILVYWFVLSSGEGMKAYIGHNLENYFVHLFTPLLVIFDYVIFGEKGHLKRNYPFIWSFVLIAYLLFNIIYVSLGGRFFGGTKYPYPCMDVEQLGLTKSIVNGFIIYIFFVGYGSIVQFIDNKLSKKKVEKIGKC